MSNKAIARLIDVKELSRVLGITKQGIFNLIKQGKFPPGVKIGGSRRRSPDDVKKYLNDSAVQQIQQQKQRNQNQENYDVHEKITQASKNIAVLSSRVIAFTGEIDSLRDSVHVLVKIVSILTNAQRNSSGLLYGQIKAALVPLTALEKEFNGDDISAQTEDSGE